MRERQGEADYLTLLLLPSPARSYFQDEKFVSYLSYLQYWKKPKYVKFIVYPHCLYFLDQLQVTKGISRSPAPTSVSSLVSPQDLVQKLT